jgi:type III restriction enzyme
MAKKLKSKSTASKPIINLEQNLPEVPDRNPYTLPTMHLVKDGKGGYIVENFRRPSKTLLVNQVRKEVDKWRESGYNSPPGISDTSLTLLEWWFDETHIFEDEEEFKYYFCQREAIETIIYLYEVKKYRDAADLVLTYMDEKVYGDDLFVQRKQIEQNTKEKRILDRVVPETGLTAHQELPSPDHYRYAIKMATGSGKTLVMAMVVEWSFFNKKYEPYSPLSKSFLIIAPNIIVFERLKEDFENGRIFNKWDLIPNIWKHDWQMTFILRGETRKSTTEGTLYLTNIQQLYEKKNLEDYLNPVDKLLGPRPKDATGSWEVDILDRIKKHNDLLIINDEAHHVHDTDLEWYKVILNFHNNLKEKFQNKLSLQLDFTATPKDQNGTFFPWIICDYPLAQAIEDRIIKAPLIVHQTDKSDPKRYAKASVAFGEWINIAIDRWKEHYEAYNLVGQKPVLFIMAENTRDADDIYDFLKKKENFKGKDQLLLIHTDKNGEVTKKDLELAREAARSIDLPSNKIKAIVSVLMLREGWDVKNVSVILGLRPFTAKSNILPEQGVGRGLRLMSRIGPDYIQILEIIGTQNFENFVRELEIEGVGVGLTRTSPSLGNRVSPLKIKEKYNVEIPILTPIHYREYNEMNSSILSELKLNPLSINIVLPKSQTVQLVETVTQKVVSQKQVLIDVGLPNINEILTHITNRVCSEARIEGKFSEIYSLVKKYVQEKFYGEIVDLENEKIRKSLSDQKNSDFIITTLAKIIGEKSISKIKSKLTSHLLSLSELDDFWWKREYVELEKTIFNITPCFNDFEIHFAKFLDYSKDIIKFAKLAESYTKFSLEYLNHKGAISKYYPDFIAVQKLNKDKHINWLIETKGFERPDVVLKDKRAEEWCNDASNLTGSEWKYIKVKYDNYVKMTENFSKFPSEEFQTFLNNLFSQYSETQIVL